MRTLITLLLSFLTLVSGPATLQAESRTFTETLSVGSEGPQVRALQQTLNQDADTRVAAAGIGSPGNESSYFGARTKDAVIRFQEKYAADILVPAALTSGNGRVGSYTRAKLNTLSQNSSSSAAVVPAQKPVVATASAYLVKSTEKTDIYIGDKLIANYKKKLYATLNSGLAARVKSRTAEPIVLPTANTAALPSIMIDSPSPRSAPPGASVSIKSTNVASASVLYFGSNYIVRKLGKGSSGSFVFTVPPVPPGLYDLAIKSGGTVSNTALFAVTDPKNPVPVRLKSISPAKAAYGGAIMLIGSGFSAKGNVVVTTHQKFVDVPSADGTTLTIRLAPEWLQDYAKISNGSASLPVSVYVANEHGFSDALSFTLAI